MTYDPWGGVALESILIVDDVEDYLRALERCLRRDWVVECARSIEEAKAKLETVDPAVAVVNLRLSEADPRIGRDWNSSGGSGSIAPVFRCS